MGASTELVDQEPSAAQKGHQAERGGAGDAEPQGCFCQEHQGVGCGKDFAPYSFFLAGCFRVQPHQGFSRSGSPESY